MLGTKESRRDYILPSPTPSGKHRERMATSPIPLPTSLLMSPQGLSLALPKDGWRNHISQVFTERLNADTKHDSNIKTPLTGVVDTSTRHVEDGAYQHPVTETGGAQEASTSPRGTVDSGCWGRDVHFFSGVAMISCQDSNKQPLTHVCVSSPN